MFFSLGCETPKETKQEAQAIKIEISEDKTLITFSYDSGRVELFCKKSEDSNTYVPCKEPI